MKTLIVAQEEVPHFLPMQECMKVMEEALLELQRGEAKMPLRQILWLPENKGALAMMPSFMGSGNVLGAKVLSFFHGNWGTPYDSHQGVILLFEGEHGSLQAIIDASSVTAIRTAAVSGVATRLLARGDACDLAILGTGIQARSHLEAMIAARPIRRIRVWSRSNAHSRHYAETESKRHGVAVEPVATAREAVVDADIICTTTSAREPVLEGAWLKNGVHLNAVGACTPVTREVDTTTIVRSSLYADRRESLLGEAGDFLIPKKEGVVDDTHIRGEIGEVLAGKISGRTSPVEITLFKSLGLAVEDLACARFIYHRVQETGGGTWLEIGGSRHDAS